MNATVTKNELNEIMKDLANRIFKNDETKITYDEYEKIIDSYEVTPFQINTNDKELEKIINTYCDTEDVEECRTVYRGSIEKEVLYNIYNNQLGYEDLYSEYYQVILKNDKLKSILTYCEGDFVAEVYNSESDYRKGIERTENFVIENLL